MSKKKEAAPAASESVASPGVVVEGGASGGTSVADCSSVVIKTPLDMLEERVVSLEGCVGETDASVAALGGDVSAFMARVTFLESRLAALADARKTPTAPAAPGMNNLDRAKAREAAKKAEKEAAKK